MKDVEFNPEPIRFEPIISITPNVGKLTIIIPPKRKKLVFIVTLEKYDKFKRLMRYGRRRRTGFDMGPIQYLKEHASLISEEICG